MTKEEICHVFAELEKLKKEVRETLELIRAIKTGWPAKRVTTNN